MRRLAPWKACTRRSRTSACALAATRAAGLPWATSSAKLGPVRTATQVEISAADGFRLGIKPPVRDSGDLEGSAKATLVGPKGAVSLPQGVVVAARHIHMNEADALRFGVRDKQKVCVRSSGERGLIFEEVLVRVSPNYSLEFHVDLDEANAAGLANGDRVTLWRP